MPVESVKVYMNDYSSSQENEDCIGKLDSEVPIIKGQDGDEDIKTKSCSMSTCKININIVILIINISFFGR